MRAARVPAVGPLADVTVEDVPNPEPGADQIRVEVARAALNPIDYKIVLSGHRGGRDFPLTLGFDAVGTVDAVGAAVTAVVPGDRVCLMTDIMSPGTLAEHVLVREHNVATVPAEVVDDQAAGLPLAGLTARQALDRTGLEAGQSILIHAGAGGVGHLAVQLAKNRGLTVYATSSAANLVLLDELGADHPVDYHTTPPGKFASAVDAVIDTRGGETAVATVAGLRPGAVHVSIVGFGSEDPGREDVRLDRMLVEPRADELAGLVDDLRGGRLRVVVHDVSPLDRARDALEALHAGHTVGKRIIAIR
jgi:NADPH:quinone reductase-like Zn-dependent oxidoreductase